MLMESKGNKSLSHAYKLQALSSPNSPSHQLTGTIDLALTLYVHFMRLLIPLLVKEAIALSTGIQQQSLSYTYYANMSCKMYLTATVFNGQKCYINQTNFPYLNDNVDMILIKTKEMTLFVR